MKAVQISDAEWQVMRILWSGKANTASDIMSALKQSSDMNWEPTTVKTLLSRLVKKEVLSYEANGRKYTYQVRLTERECIQNEMKGFIHKIYGGPLLYQTEHFNLYGGGDVLYAAKIADTLEMHYLRIGSHLQCDFEERRIVYIHDSQERLHSALGIVNGPKWLRGGLTWDVMHIAPEPCFDDLSAEKVAIHLLAQVMVSQLSESLPYWLMHGVSAYEAQWLERNRITHALERYTEQIHPLDFATFESSFEKFKERGGYEIAYTVVEYIIETFGYTTLVEYIKKPSDYQVHFHQTASEFWLSWVQFIQTQYGVKRLL